MVINSEITLWHSFVDKLLTYCYLTFVSSGFYRLFSGEEKHADASEYIVKICSSWSLSADLLFSLPCGSHVLLWYQISYVPSRNNFFLLIWGSLVVMIQIACKASFRVALMYSTFIRLIASVLPKFWCMLDS